jgi:hypothetical protein
LKASTARDRPVHDHVGVDKTVPLAKRMPTFSAHVLPGGRSKAVNGAGPFARCSFAEDGEGVVAAAVVDGEDFDQVLGIGLALEGFDAAGEPAGCTQAPDGDLRQTPFGGVVGR